MMCSTITVGNPILLKFAGRTHFYNSINLCCAKVFKPKNAVILQLALKVSEQFKDINFAVTRLRHAIEEFYNTSGGRTATKPCCSNLTNAKYNEAFRTQVKTYRS